MIDRKKGEKSVKAKETSIGEKLRVFRQRLKMTLIEVEDQTGVPKSTLHDIETGRIKSPTFADIKKLCKFYRLDMNKL